MENEPISTSIREDDLNLMNQAQGTLETVSVGELIVLIELTILSTISYAQIKNQSVSLNEVDDNTRGMLLDINPYLIQKTFTELLMNAYKYSDRNRVISVKIERQGDLLFCKIENISDPELTRHRGIPKKYKHKVFEPHFRLTDDSQKDYETPEKGIGLAVVNNVAKQHGGTVSLMDIPINEDKASKRDHLIRVTLQLPLNLENRS